MSGFISNLIGSGAALILVAIALLIKKHRHHLQRLNRKVPEWSLAVALVLMVLAGWVSLIYRIDAEEQILSRDPGWSAYVRTVRYRLLPAFW